MTDANTYNLPPIFAEFCHPHGVRSAPKHPFRVGEHVYAEDGRRCVRMPYTPSMGDIPVDETYPAPTLPWSRDNRATLSTSGITRDIYPQQDVCPKCNGRKRLQCYGCYGDGERQCDMGHDHECDVCDGDGNIDCANCGGIGSCEQLVTVTWQPAREGHNSLNLASIIPLIEGGFTIYAPKGDGLSDLTFYARNDEGIEALVMPCKDGDTAYVVGEDGTVTKKGR